MWWVPPPSLAGGRRLCERVIEEEHYEVPYGKVRSRRPERDSHFMKAISDD
jgi:hypothetical protein